VSLASHTFFQATLKSALHDSKLFGHIWNMLIKHHFGPLGTR